MNRIPQEQTTAWVLEYFKGGRITCPSDGALLQVNVSSREIAPRIGLLFRCPQCGLRAEGQGQPGLEPWEAGQSHQLWEQYRTRGIASCPTDGALLRSQRDDELVQLSCPFCGRRAAFRA